MENYLKTSPDYDISKPVQSLEETYQQVRREYERAVSSREESTQRSKIFNETCERISVTLSEIQARLESENEQLANAARNNLNFQNSVSNSTLDINSEYLPNLEDEVRIKDTTLDEVHDDYDEDNIDEVFLNWL